MENSRKILADGSQVEWFVVQGDRWLGPMTVAEVFEKVQAQEISWAHYGWRQGESSWRRLCDIPEFQAAVPDRPGPSVQDAVKTEGEKTDTRTRALKQPPAPPTDEPRSWFLFYNESQFGPFSPAEVSRFLRIGKIHGRVYAWRDGLETWTRILDLPEFKADLAEAERVRPTPPRPKEKSDEKRAGPRKPLVARLIMANDAAVVVAVCRDVSLGGMQVLTDKLPGKVGQKLKMNITPGGGNPGGSLEPFIAEGVVVRILEDGRGFSFRFERLADQAQKAVESYIAQGG